MNLFQETIAVIVVIIVLFLMFIFGAIKYHGGYEKGKDWVHKEYGVTL